MRVSVDDRYESDRGSEKLSRFFGKHSGYLFPVRNDRPLSIENITSRVNRWKDSKVCLVTFIYSSKKITQPVMQAKNKQPLIGQVIEQAFPGGIQMYRVHPWKWCPSIFATLKQLVKATCHNCILATCNQRRNMYVVYTWYIQRLVNVHFARRINVPRVQVFHVPISRSKSTTLATPMQRVRNVQIERCINFESTLLCRVG